MEGAETIDEMMIEIDGRNARPEIIDSSTALEVYAAYLDLLQHVADELELSLKFTGLRIEPKCTAVAIHVSDAEAATRASKVALRYVAGHEMPRGLNERTRRMRDALHAIEENGQRANVLIGPWKQRLVALERHPELPPSSVLELRVTPLRIGGRNPRIWFESESEDLPFTLSVTKKQAQDIGPHIYKSIDVVAKVARDAEGNIDDGEVLTFEPMDGGDATLAWKGWYKEAAPGWDEIEDLEGALRRDDD